MEPIQLTRSNVREANRGDIKTLKELDEACFEYAMSEQDFSQALKSRGEQVVLLVELDSRVVAFMIYSRPPKRRTATVLRLAVREEYRRRRLGSGLLAWVGRELDAATRYMVCVQEDDVPAQLFLRSNKFVYVKTRPDYYSYGDDTKADAYEFVSSERGMPPDLTRTSKPKGPLMVNLKNRCKKYFKDDEPQDADID